jgi:nicotinate phosphoribosyltransferase
MKTDTQQPIIRSLLDTDLYKFTMMQVILHRFPGVGAEYTFICRNRTEFPLGRLVEQIKAEIDHLCTLRFQPEELSFLRSLRFIKGDFVDFLELFQLRRKFIAVEPSKTVPNGVEIQATGSMLHTMLFEIYVLAIVNELYFRQFDELQSREIGRRRLKAKIDILKAFAKEPSCKTPFVFFDFGTRRRFSRDWHEEVINTLVVAVPEFFRGSSNVDMARRKGLVPIGTMAHEYLQAHQALDSRLRDFQKSALENWVMEYRGDLGIALTDVVGMDAFLRDFDLYFAKLFDGLRHDSGDPFAWGERALKQYEQLKIDAGTKMLVFSDGLDLERAISLYRRFGDRAKTGFGIGTNLTNDCGPEPLQIVMKLTRCNGQPVAKLSDSPGKTMCTDENFLNYLRDLFPVGAIA